MPGGTNPTGGIVEYFKPGAVITMTASATITGGQIVALTGDRAVGPAASGSVTAIGVALHDAANGEVVSVATAGVWPITAQGAVAAGNRLICGTVAGTVAASGATPDARTLIGIALEAISDTNTGRVLLGGVL